MARFWEHFGCFLKVLGRHFRACNTSLKRFAELLENLLKIKVRRLRNRRKNQLGEQLGTKSDATFACETEFWSQDC